MSTIPTTRFTINKPLLVSLLAASVINATEAVYAADPPDFIFSQMAVSDGSPYFEEYASQARLASANNLAANASGQVDSIARQMAVSDGSPYLESAQPQVRIGGASRLDANVAQDRWLEQQLSTSDGSSTGSYAVAAPERQIGDDERLLIAGRRSADRSLAE